MRRGKRALERLDQDIRDHIDQETRGQRRARHVDRRGPLRGSQGVWQHHDRQRRRASVADMEQLVWTSTARPRFFTVLVGIFAAVAGGLAAIGIYGVLAYAVTQRTREIGMRMALGAQRRQVLSLVLSQGGLLTAIGMLLGLGGAVGVARYLKSMLFGLTSLDPPTFVGVSIAFALIATLASYSPARRATKVDPLTALRHE
jgi:putative ABC transport system permease protein